MSALVLLSATSASAEERRLALVVGNTDYAHLAPLANAERDAAEIGAVLESLGYEVTVATNVDRNGFQVAAREFLGKLEDADAALFYYAGHGIQIENENYLLPLDAELSSLSDVSFDAVPLKDIIGMMERNAKTTIVLLDSCRDNPLRASFPRSQTRAVALQRGLAPEFGSAGTFIAFSAQPGAVSYDGDGSNSPFATALLDHMKQPGLDIRLMMADVRQQVIEATDGKQIPWENSALSGRFSINPGGNGTANDDGATADSGSPDVAQLADEAISRRLIILDGNETDEPENAAPQPLASPAPQARDEEQRASLDDTRNRDAVAALSNDSETKDVIGNVDAEPDRETLSDKELARGLQRELVRVGCMRGSVDGIWGPLSRSSLERYAKAEELTLTSLDPNIGLLDRLRGQKGRICPLVCRATEVVSGDRCVRKTCPSGQTLQSNGSCVTVRRQAPVVRRQAPAPQPQRAAEPARPKVPDFMDRCNDPRKNIAINC
ncbi:MAG: caspase family protein [Rhizobiaceae bacterium]|nr:caspase family protein [Rhizobiaceae bacterium]